MAGEIMLRKPREGLKAALRHIASEDGSTVDKVMDRALFEWCRERLMRAGLKVEDGKVIAIRRS